MNFEEYIAYFESIVNTKHEDLKAPYNKPGYYDYLKLNWSRTSRWLKTEKISNDLLNAIKKINKPQHWLLISEPWCGDAAHNVPFIQMAARENPLVTLTIELRDSAPHSIEQYLTNGTKSIPKLVIRDEAGNDLAIWGPRPKECQLLYARLVEEKVSSDELTLQIHSWYNADKGASIQHELAEVISGTI